MDTDRTEGYEDAAATAKTATPSPASSATKGEERTVMAKKHAERVLDQPVNPGIQLAGPAADQDLVAAFDCIPGLKKVLQDLGNSKRRRDASEASLKLAKQEAAKKDRDRNAKAAEEDAALNSLRDARSKEGKSAKTLEDAKKANEDDKIALQNAVCDFKRSQEAHQMAHNEATAAHAEVTKLSAESERDKDVLNRVENLLLVWRHGSDIYCIVITIINVMCILIVTFIVC